MKKKILIAVVAVVVVLGVALGVVVANLGRIVNSRKGELLEQARARTGRELSIGEVGVALWPDVGVRIGDVAVGDDPSFSSDPFIRARDVRINVALFPLLRQQVVFKRVVLNEPFIVVIRGEGGRFNYTSLIEKAVPAADGSGSRPKAAPAAVLVFADVRDGSVRYLDRARDIDRTVRDIDFALEGKDDGQSFEARLDAAVFGGEQDVHVSAKVGPISSRGSMEALRAAPLSAAFELETVTISELQAVAKRSSERAREPVEGEVSARGALSGTAGEANLDEVVIAAALLGAKEPNVEVRASAGPFNLLADSTLLFAAARVKGALSAAPLPLSGLVIKRARADAPSPVLGGEVEVRASFEGPPAAVAFDGEIDATGASCLLPASFEKKSGVPARVSIKGVWRPRGEPGEGIEFSRLDLTLHALSASGTGRIVPFRGREAMEFALEGKTPIAPWKDLLPAILPFSPAGDAALSVRVTGTPKAAAPPRIEGSARVTDFSAMVSTMPKPVTSGSATLSFTTETVRVMDARFRVGASHFQLDADVASVKPMQAAYTLRSQEVHRADVQAAPAGAKAPPRPEVFRDVVATGRMREAAVQVIESEMALSSGSGVASNVDYTDFAAEVRAARGQVFIDRYAARALGGTVSGRGTFEPKLAKFDLETKVEKVNLAEYFRYKAAALSDVLVGRIDLDLSLSGEGRSWEEVQKTLAGTGRALVVEGALLNVNLADRLFASIQGLPMVPADLAGRMRAKHPALFAQNRTAFENLGGRITIADGRIRTPDLKLATDNFVVAGAGWFSFGKEIHMSTTLTLSETLTRDLVAEVPAARFLVSPNGKLDLPLTFTGAIAKPAVGVDADAVAARLRQSLLGGGQRQLEQGLKDEVKSLLDGFGKKKEPEKKP